MKSLKKTYYVYQSSINGRWIVRNAPPKSGDYIPIVGWYEAVTECDRRNNW